jgi:predicted Zn-dependent protease
VVIYQWCGFKHDPKQVRDVGLNRVKNVSIAGNVYELLREVTAVSRETLWVYNGFCLPYILLPEVSVVAQE